MQTTAMMMLGVYFPMLVIVAAFTSTIHGKAIDGDILKRFLQGTDSSMGYSSYFKIANQL